MENIFITTAVYNKQKKYYQNFNISKKFAYIWNKTPENVEKIQMKISEDQSKPDIKIQEYWGWYDNKEQKFTLIYENFLLLHICFPYGLEEWEKINVGKAYRLEIIGKITQDGEEGGLLNH